MEQSECIKTKIRQIREEYQLGRTEFANLLGLGASGERTVRGWEEGEHYPSRKKIDDVHRLLDELENIRNLAPFSDNRQEHSFKFIDLFGGIGGLRLPFQELGGKCVFTSEWDKFAQKTYLANFGEVPSGDITQIAAHEIPPHDLLLAGFPCQAFSQAGLKKGFEDTRGTMFFEIQRILAKHRPRAFLLENVKQLRGHDKGRTLKTILSVLRGDSDAVIDESLSLSQETREALSHKLNYWVDVKVLKAADFGAPQNRERIFILGFNKDLYPTHTSFEERFEWPEAPKSHTRVGDILEPDSVIEKDDKYTISDRLWQGHQARKIKHKKNGNGFGFSLFTKESPYTNTISARYYKDGSEILIDQSHLGKNPRKLTPRECARLQGFPEKFNVDAVSHVQIYKQFGNSVCVNVIRAIAKKMIQAL